MSHIQRIVRFVSLFVFLVSDSSAKAQDSVQAGPKQYKVASVADLTGSVSPDGRHYAFTDWRTGNLVVKDLKMGEERRLTDKDSWDESTSMHCFRVYHRTVIRLHTAGTTKKDSVICDSSALMALELASCTDGSRHLRSRTIGRLTGSRFWRASESKWP